MQLLTRALRRFARADARDAKGGGVNRISNVYRERQVNSRSPASDTRPQRPGTYVTRGPRGKLIEEISLRR